MKREADGKTFDVQNASTLVTEILASSADASFSNVDITGFLIVKPPHSSDITNQIEIYEEGTLFDASVNHIFKINTIDVARIDANGLIVSGNKSITANTFIGELSGNVIQPSQTNITDVCTLTGLNMGGNTITFPTQSGGNFVTNHGNITFGSVAGDILWVE